jgi:syntaxin-binding protein 1
MVLVLDDSATRVISSALTMYDIMERRITLVEQLSRPRQPFKEMEAIYLLSPTAQSATLLLQDFQNEKQSKYGGVHLYFLDSISADVMTLLQGNPLLCSRIRTLKEVHMDFISAESNVFHLDMPRTLGNLFGNPTDTLCPSVMAHKLATLCISLNEYPSIRYLGSSRYAQETATVLNRLLTDFKRTNASTFWTYGDEGHQDRDRGQLLVLDRSFDPLSPLMHEYTYQAMVEDLLPVRDGGVISYSTETASNTKVEKEVILNDSDEFWVEQKYSHIARVIEVVREKMNDIIQNNAGAARLEKQAGQDMSITDMAEAVKQLPEYRQTVSKLNQHVRIAQQCMDAFGKSDLMEVSQLEQSMSTGVDEDGKEFKGSKLVENLTNVLRKPLGSSMKLRLMAIFVITQRGVSSEDRRQLGMAAGLSGPEQQVLTNFEKLCVTLHAAQGPGKGSMFSMFKGKAAPKHAATAEGDYADTRHICRLKQILEQIIASELPSDKFPALGPPAGAGGGGDGKAAAKSVRRFGNNSRWGRNQTQFSGGRFIVFVAGGISYSELRTGHDLMVQHTKEIVMGGSHIISPNKFVEDVAMLDPVSARAFNNGGV